MACCCQRSALSSTQDPRRMHVRDLNLDQVPTLSTPATPTLQPELCCTYSKHDQQTSRRTSLLNGSERRRHQCPDRPRPRLRLRLHLHLRRPPSPSQAAPLTFHTPRPRRKVSPAPPSRAPPHAVPCARTPSTHPRPTMPNPHPDRRPGALATLPGAAHFTGYLALHVTATQQTTCPAALPPRTPTVPVPHQASAIFAAPRPASGNSARPKWTHPTTCSTR